MNGKGDKPRPVNKKQYDKNFYAIFGKKAGESEMKALQIVIKAAELGTGVRDREQKNAIKILKSFLKK